MTFYDLWNEAKKIKMKTTPSYFAVIPGKENDKKRMEG